MAPAPLCSQAEKDGRADSRAPSAPAPRATRPNPNMVSTTKARPSTIICRAGWPWAGRTNCGKKARKNTATLGLRRLARMDWRKMTRAALFSPSADRARAGSARQSLNPR